MINVAALQVVVVAELNTSLKINLEAAIDKNFPAPISLVYFVPLI